MKYVWVRTLSGTVPAQLLSELGIVITKTEECVLVPLDPKGENRLERVCSNAIIDTGASLEKVTGGSAGNTFSAALVGGRSNLG